MLDKQLDEALASVDKAVLLTASLPEAHYQRGIVFMFRKEYGGALDAFTKATELDPTFASAYYYAGLAALPHQTHRSDGQQLRDVRQAGAERA